MLIKHIADPVSERTAPSPVISNTTNMASNTGSSSTTQYTPSPTPSTVRYRDPDYPLPSIERDTTSTSAYSQINTPLSPSVSPHAEALRQGSEYGSLDQRLQNLELHSVHPQRSISSPENTASQRERSIASPTPSIHVTPTTSATYSHHSTANAGIEGLAHGVSALQTSPSHRRAQSAQPNNHLRHDSVDGSRAIRRSTASPSRRRRSSSGINRSTHRVEDEEPPQALFHERRIQEALTNARNVTGRLARVLSEANLHQEQGSSIQSMCQHAIRLSTFEPPSRRIVGLVGDSGVGKSSLINSLLDKVEFARASNSGAACTCVVTEYHFHDRDDYSIDIDYFTVQELRTQFEQLLSAYREHESTTEDDVRQAMRQKADLAKSTFQASFRNKLDDDPEVLGTLPFNQAINKMMVWVLEVVPGLDTRDRDTRDRDTRESFEDINQCSNRLRILTSDTEERDQACLWPFIRKLKVHMKAYILSKGLILADLPGLRDLNYARQNVTERYIRQCDQLFAITRIGRATTDAGVQEVFELARRASLSNVGVVCTQSDKDIRLSEANNDWPDERVTISGMEEDIAHKQRELASLNEDIDELNELLLRSTDDAQELLELLRERDRVMKSLDGSEFELRRHIITVRNQRVCSDLQRRYSTHPDLQIFCVSNTIYSQERNKPVQESLPFLNLSGILGLRRYCIGIVAESHLRASTEYIKNEIPALLGSVELWIQAASVNTNAERKQQITDAVSVIQSELDGLTSPVSRISDITDQITSRFDDQLQQYMRQRKQQWSTSAGEACMSWSSLHHSTYSAFCRKYGTYNTEAAGSRCWNEEAISLMNSDMSGLWGTFDGNVASYLDEIHQDLDQVFRNILRLTSGAANSNNTLRARLNPLIATLRHRKSLLLHGIEIIIEDFRSKMSDIQTDAFSPIRTSIIGQLMEADYNAANMEYGRGSDRRRKTIISSGFRSRSLFVDHRRRLRSQFISICEELQQETTDTVAQQLRFIETDLNTLRNENVVLESERNPEFRTRLELEVTQAREEMGTVRAAINDLFNSTLEDTVMDK